MVDASKERHRQKTAYFDYLRATAGPVDEYVQAFLERHYALAPETRKLLSERYLSGHRKLRPAIMRLAYEVVGGADWHEVIPFCAAVQVREAGYYCIDDILDQRASDHGLILLGCAFYSLSNAMVGEAIRRLDPVRAARILAEFSQLDENTLQGAILDQAMHGTDEAYYWRKVTGYNFWEQALQIGALCTGTPDETVELLGRIGKQIGMAYIVANDAYDIAKDGEDFRQGKATLPIMYMFEHAAPGDRAQLKALFGSGNLEPDEAGWVAAIMVRCGAIDHCKHEAAKLCESAIELLHQLPDSAARGLLEFSTTYTQRNRHFTALDKLRQA